MEHEYIENIAAELAVDGEGMQEVIDRLGIETLQMAVPPYGAEVSTVVRHQDADRLRAYFAE